MSASFAFFAKKEVKGFWACGHFLHFRLWQVLKGSKKNITVLLGLLGIVNWNSKFYHTLQFK